MKIFISHSVSPKELAIIDIMAEEATRRGITPTISNRDWNPNRTVPMRIKKLIKESDYMIAIATKKGHHFQWFNAEITYSQNLRPKKPLLLVSDTSIQIDSSAIYLYHDEGIIINRENPLVTISKVALRIKEITHDEKTQKLLDGFLINVVVLLLLLKELINKED